MNLVKASVITISVLLVLTMFPRTDANIIDIQGLENWNDQLQKAGITLAVVQFHVKWCSYCRFMKPVFVKIARNYQDVIFLNVEVDENRDIAWRNGIRSVPTYKYFKNATVIDSVSTINPQIINDLIYRLK